MDSTKARSKGSHEAERIEKNWRMSKCEHIKIGEKNQTARWSMIVQSLMPRPWSPFKTWRSTFFVGHCIIWIIMIMGSYRKQGCPLSNFVCFVSPSFFSSPFPFVSRPPLSNWVSLPQLWNQTICTTYPQKKNEQKKAKDSGENPGPKQSWESRIPIVFLFVLGCDFDRFFL